MKHINIQIIFAIGLFLNGIIVAQPEVGLTKNTFFKDGYWHIESDGIQDGSTGGCIFFNNDQEINFNIDSSYWVGGLIKLSEPITHQESFTSINPPYCINETSSDWLVHYPLNSDSNRAALFRSFFQFFWSDYAGIFQDGVGKQDRRRLFFRRNVGNKMVSEVTTTGPIIYDSLLQKGYSIKFIAAFVKVGYSISDSRIPEGSRSGMFLYYQILDDNNQVIIEQNADPLNNICYNSNNLSPGHNAVRIYIGADSHGNLQNSEPSVSLWSRRIEDKDILCGTDLPHNMNPLLGAIKRMIFVQGVLDVENVDDFFISPLDYHPDNIKLDFPSVIEKGYDLLIPNSHWIEYDNPDNGKVIYKTISRLPNESWGKQISGLRTQYLSNDSLLDYGIKYNLTERHEEYQRKYNKVRFFIGNQDIIQKPNFHFYALVNVLSPDSTLQKIYIQSSPSITKNSWDESTKYIKINIKPDENGKYFDRYTIDLDYWLKELTDFIKVESIDGLYFRGIFDLAKLTLFNH